MLNKIQKGQIQTALLKLGFSKKESLVYICVLAEKDSSIISISKGSGLSRGTVYDLVEKLKEKGYLSEIKKGKKRRIVIENPTNRFYSFLDEKHEKLERQKKTVENILTVIKSVDHFNDFKPQVRIYEGEKGFHQVWDDIFSCQEKCWVGIARIETFLKFCGQDYIDKIQKRKVALGFTSKMINETSPEAKKLFLLDKKYNRQTILAPKEFVFPSTEFIYGDKIAMFSTQEENIILVIESKDFAQTHRAYFNMMWKFLGGK